MQISNREIPTVEELLDSIDYSFPNYIPSEEALRFFNFIRLVLGREPENTNSLAHYFMIDMIFGNIEKDNLPYPRDIRGRLTMDPDRFAVLAHREFAKSVVLGTMLPLFFAAEGYLPNRGKLYYGIYVGDSMENNVQTTMRTIGSIYDDSLYLQEIFETYKFTDKGIKLVRKPSFVGERIADRTFVYKGFGAQVGVRGSRAGLTRPQFAIIDDTVKSESDASSEATLKSIHSTIYSDVLEGLDTIASFAILIGTPYNKKDPVYDAIESGGWTPIVYPVCIKIYEGMPEEEFVGSWENRHSYEKVMKKYNRAVRGKKLRSFMQEQMLRIIDEESMLVNIDNIRSFSAKDVLMNAHAYSWYITTDFTSTGNKSSDDAVIFLWALSANGDYMLVQGEVGVMDIETQYDILFKYVSLVQAYGKYPEVGIEVDGQQAVHIHALEIEKPRRGIFFSLAKQKGSENKIGISAKRTGEGKLGRFKLFMPVVEAGKFWMSKDFFNSKSGKITTEQLSLLTLNEILSRKDDAIDGISQIALMKTTLPLPQDYTELNKNIDATYDDPFAYTHDDDEYEDMFVV